ncbi:hypothetical protein TSA6c_17080 [Azospirillum sp. TSA6c]|uniref:hypothetical protein n=1 Tax=Azospirillum sp. TSA6c TaxID=709813 RepID=UPI000D60F66A|nr:hypothetical protein [Azospirillum sp. TSA6c]PWC48148.1 hypothetical protein TSA6c_17080 [Azospirillum sp. TSA6c]
MAHTVHLLLVLVVLNDAGKLERQVVIDEDTTPSVCQEMKKLAMWPARNGQAIEVRCEYRKPAR